MPSRILYDERTNEILWCQPNPHGNAYPGNHRTLCKSARVPFDEREFMKVVSIDKNLFTKDAKERYRIIDGKVYPKPDIALQAKKHVNIQTNPDLEIKAQIRHCHKTHEIPEKITISINGAEVDLRRDGNRYQETVTFTAVGDYVIDVVSPNYHHNKITVEVSG